MVSVLGVSACVGYGSDMIAENGKAKLLDLAVSLGKGDFLHVETRFRCAAMFATVS